MKSEEQRAKSFLKFGLIGKRLDYSFSKKYFTEKFDRENILASYHSFEMDDLQLLKKTLQENNISGFNITNPFKEKIIPLLDALSENAQEINAVNCVKITSENKWIGHNTDVIGFEKSLLNLLNKENPKALVFGTGGASQAIQFVLKKLSIDFQLVSRNKKAGRLQYEDLNKAILAKHQLLINTTPLGTSPNIKECVDIPYEFITEKHVSFDVVYNPKISEFLKRSEAKRASIKNGLEMLETQAEESWKIWDN